MNAHAEATTSLWMDTKVLADAPPLQGRQEAETVVVGAGIAGLSVAYELAAAGQKVIVVERGAVGGGMTARTTAHLSPICDDGLSRLVDLRGPEAARLFQQSQAAAVDRIERIVNALAIDCGFRRLDGFLFPAIGMDQGEAGAQLDAEFEASRRIGAAVERANGVPLAGLQRAPALRYPGQATFHPLRYLSALAGGIADAGGRLFARSPVEEIRAGAGGVTVTANGATITAERVVVATNAPVNKRAEIHSKMAPYRTYAMAFTIPRDAVPDALYWDMADPYHYVRLSRGDGDADHLIAGGEDHKTGEADDGDARFSRLEAWLRPLVPALGREVHRWSGQVMNTLDHCGYIGRDPSEERTFIVCGDSGQGMTHGVLAGLLLKDLILSGSSPWEQVYDPARKSMRAAGTYVSENSTAVRNFAEYLLPGEIGSADELAPGEGGILRDGVKRLAASRDRQGVLHVRSAVCSHLGCHVNWNPTEQCWDCPCHGSHFAPDGSVLNGPALSPLAEAAAPGKR